MILTHDSIFVMLGSIPDCVASDFIWHAVLMRWLCVLEKVREKYSYHFRHLVNIRLPLIK